MRSVDITELHGNLEALIQEVKQGAEIIITDNDQPVIRLMPPVTQRQPGLHPGAIQMSDDFDAPLPDSFWVGDD
jgi:prevent-host-death family protein